MSCRGSKADEDASPHKFDERNRRCMPPLATREIYIFIEHSVGDKNSAEKTHLSWVRYTVSGIDFVLFFIPAPPLITCFLYDVDSRFGINAHQRKVLELNLSQNSS